MSGTERRRRRAARLARHGARREAGDGGRPGRVSGGRAALPGAGVWVCACANFFGVILDPADSRELVHRTRTSQVSRFQVIVGTEMYDSKS